MNLHRFIFACALALLMSVTTAANAQEKCGYSASVLKSGFERGEQPSQVALSPQNTPLTLNVIYPAEGGHNQCLSHSTLWLFHRAGEYGHYR